MAKDGIAHYPEKIVFEDFDLLYKEMELIGFEIDVTPRFLYLQDAPDEEGLCEVFATYERVGDFTEPFTGGTYKLKKVYHEEVRCPRRLSGVSYEVQEGRLCRFEDKVGGRRSDGTESE
jgi:hypothetical protein